MYIHYLIKKNTSSNFCCKEKELAKIEKKVQEKVNKLTVPNKIIKKQSTKEYIQKNKKCKVEKRCSKCCSVIARGKTHKCNLTSFIDNIHGNLNQYNLKEKEHMISSLLKTTINEKKKKCELLDTNNIPLSQRNGKPLRVAFQPKKTEIPLITVDSLRKMQTDLDLSKRKTLGVPFFIRTETKLPNIIEPNYEKKLDEKSKIFDEYFEARLFNFVKLKKGSDPENISQNVVICKDLAGLIYYIVGYQELTGVNLKFGVDGGGGFLKFCLIIQTSYEDTVKEYLANKSASRCNKKFPNSGVKKLIIICLAPSTQENYENISLIWSALNINEFLGVVAADIKLLNIMCGYNY